eukprot:tig00001331_g8165.t1
MVRARCAGPPVSVRCRPKRRAKRPRRRAPLEPAVQEAHTAAPADDVEPLQLAEGLRGVPAPFQLPGAAAPVEDDEEEDSIGASSEGDAVEADAAWDEAGAPLDSAECLGQEGVLGGRNLVYCAPTSGGKTSQRRGRRRKHAGRGARRLAIVVLPFVAVVAHLRAVLAPLRARVTAFHGGQGGPLLSPRVDVAVCTIEKAAAMVNAYVEAGRLSSAAVGTVVVDEAHMVGDGDRGPLLELTLTKLLFHDPARSIQVVAMSATLPNVGALARWLGAALYTTDFRPVPLSEFLKIGDTLYSRDMSVARTLRVAPRTPPATTRTAYVMLLVHETVSQGHSVLVFCQSRQARPAPAEGRRTRLQTPIPSFRPAKTARGCSRGSSPPPPPGADRAADRLRALRNAVLDELRSLPSGLDETLAFTIPAGVGVHTAGLAADERDAVERGFRSGAIHASPEYRQARHDEVLRIMSAPLPPLDSCLRDPERGLARVLAEAVGSGAVARREDAARFVRCTLLASLDGSSGDGTRSPHDPRRAVFLSGLSPPDALTLYEDLVQARRGLVLSHDAHLAFLSTPPRAAPEPPDWGLLFRLHAALRGDARRAADLCGVSEAFLCAAARTPPPYGSPERGAVLHRRFFGALALCDLLQERPIGAVAAKFGLARGQLQSLQTSASGFAGAIAGLCDGLNWWQLRLIAARFRDRLAAGVQAELLDLVRVPGVTAARARALHRAGFRTLQALAAAPEKELAAALRRLCAPPPSAAERDAARDPKQATLSPPSEGEERRAEADALAHLGGEPEGEAEAEEGTPGRTPAGLGAGAEAQGRPGGRGGVAGAPREPRRQTGREARPRRRPGLAGAPGPPLVPSPPRSGSSSSSEEEGRRGASSSSSDGGPLSGARAPMAPGRRRPGEWGGRGGPGPGPAGPSRTAAKPAPGPAPGAAEEERRLASAAAAGELDELPPGCPPERWAALAADWRAARAVAIACAFAPPDAEPEDEEEEGEEGGGEGTTADGAPRRVCADALRRRRRRRRLERLADPSARAPQARCWAWRSRCAPGGPSSPGSARPAPGPLRAARRARAAALAALLGGAPPGLLVGHGLKESLRALAEEAAGASVPPGCGLFDVAVGAWMLHPDDKRDLSLDQLALHFAPEGRPRAPSTAAQHVACRRAALALALQPRISAALQGQGLLSAFASTEMPLVPVLAAMEAAGFGFDAPYLNRFKRHAEFKLRVLEREAHRLAGRKFDLRSPPELAAVLLGELRVGEMAAALGVELPPRLADALAEKDRWLPSGGGVLKALARVHPLPAVLAEHRSLRFHYSKYIAPLPRYAEWSDGPAGPERRVHATVVQTHTATGRLALSRPNLHMTPREPFTFAPVRYWTAKSIHEELEEGAEFEDLSERGPDTPANAAWWRDNDFRRVRVNCTSLRQRGAIVRGVLLQVTGESVEEAQIRARAGPGEGGEGEGEGSAGSSGEDEGEEGEGEGGAAPTMSLADYWRVEGYAYTPARAAAVKQVRVRVRVGGVQRVLSYPADQVWRVLSNAMAVTDPSKFRPRPGINVPLSASSSASDPPEEDDALRAERAAEAERCRRVYGVPPPPPAAGTEGGEGPEGTPGELSVHVRDALVAGAGRTLLSVDYSQIEVRLMAHFSGDALLCAALSDPGAPDVFRRVAADFLDMPLERVTERERSRAKKLIYAILYGSGPEALAAECGCPVAEARAFAARFKEKYKGVAEFLAATVERCRRDGFVTTLFGRRRYLPAINSRDTQLRRQAERQAVNTVCQGSAADLVKRAMVHVHAHIARCEATPVVVAPEGGAPGEGRRGPAGRGPGPGLEGRDGPGCCPRPHTVPASAGAGLLRRGRRATGRGGAGRRPRLLLQMHDELVFEVPAPALGPFREAVEGLMAGAADLRVPLRVKAQAGPRWGSLAPLPPLPPPAPPLLDRC